MAFKKTFRDNFDRPNEDPIRGIWENAHPSGGVRIDSNAVSALGPTSTNLLSRLRDSWSADQEAQVTFATLGNFDFAGPAVRLDGFGNGYAIKTDGRAISDNRLIRLDGGVAVSLGGGQIALVVGDKVKLTIRGSRLSAFVNNILVDSVNDSTYVAGNPGILYDVENVRATTLDDFVSVGLRKKRFAFTDIPKDVKLVPTRKVWTKQPPPRVSTDSSPYTQGLTHVLIGSHDRIDNGIRGIENNTPTRRNNTKGQYWNFTESSLESIDWGPGEDIFNDGVGSFLSRFRIPSGKSGNGRLLVCSRTGSSLERGIELFYKSTGTSMNVRGGDGSNNSEVGAINITGHFDEWLTAFFTYNSDSNLASFVLYGENGDVIGATIDAAWTVNDFGVHTQNLFFAKRGVLFFEGDVEFLMVWNRNVEIAIANGIGENPYQIFDPRIISIPFNEELPKLAVVEKSW